MALGLAAMIVGVHNCAVAQQQALLAQHRVDLSEQPTARQAQACKLAYWCDVVERFFHRRVAQCKPLLHEVDAKHRLKGVGLASVARLWIHRLDERCEPCSRDDFIHLC